jgi:hypothetical protein
MTSEPHPSLGQRVYRALFKVFGPADVGPSGPRVPINPDDKTVPAGYHLETITDGSGIRRRIAVQDSPDENPGPTSSEPAPDQK